MQWTTRDCCSTGMSNGRRLTPIYERDEPRGGDRYHERRDPDQARAVAVVRSGEHAADEGIGKQPEAGRAREQAQIGELAPAKSEQKHEGQERQRPERERSMQEIQVFEVKRAVALQGRVRGRNHLREQPLDRPIGVPDRHDDAVAGLDHGELLCGRAQRGRDVQRRILHQALGGDRRHLGPAVEEAADPREGAVGTLVPEEIVAGRRQAIEVRAEPLALLAVAAVIDEELLYDAVLHEPTESERSAAGGPGELAGDGEVRARHQGGAEHEREGGAP